MERSDRNLDETEDVRRLANWINKNDQDILDLNPNDEIQKSPTVSENNDTQAAFVMGS